MIAVTFYNKNQITRRYFQILNEYNTHCSARHPEKWIVSLSRFFLFISVLLAATPLTAQQIQTFADTDSVRVGDTINLSVVIEGKDTLISYPDSSAFSEDLELQNRQRFQVTSQRDSIVYSLQYFGVEDIVIDPLPFEVRAGDRDTTLQSNRVPLFFKTTLAEEEESLRPFKPIFEFARNYWPYIIGLILVLIAGYLIYRYVKERARKDTYIPEPFEKKPFINPLDELEKAILSLQSGTHPTDEKEFEIFYVKLADAIRTYLKRVYDFPALEMTTREIITELQKQRASADLIKKVRKVLNDADMVKFAKFNPASDQVSDAIHTGVDFLETAKTIDSERIQYLEHLHNEEQESKRAEHEKEQNIQKQEFEQ